MARRGRRWPWIVAAALVIVVATAIVVRKTLLRDRTRTVSTDQALNRFRSVSATTTPTTDAPPTTAPPTIAPPTTAMPLLTAPPPGVYRYTTEGEESVDALGGTTHHYPAETTITVTADACGVLFRWDALQERRDEWRLCATRQGLVQGKGLQYHEFFGQPDAEDVVCPTPPVMVPAVVAAGPAVETDCTLAADPWIVYWQVIGRETRTVGGTAVDTVHVRQSVNDAADIGEQSTVDWYLDDHGLPISVTATKRSKSSSPIGAVLYQEHYTLNLESRSPQR